METCSIFILSGLTLLIIIIVLRALIRGLNVIECDPRIRIDGKTAIITGANAGVGLETARDLARRGARVILACRDLERVSDTVVPGY